MTKKSDAPAIRFKGFSDAWEQRKLGDIASDMVAGGDIDKDLILAEGQYPVIANALTGDGIVGYYDKEYRVNAPAVTVTGRGDVGHAKARLVNFTPVVRLLSVKSEHDVFFLENAINTLKIVIESTGVPQLTVPQLAKYEVAFPRQLDEEEHIGAFFKQLDHLITLHQRKFEKLTNVKKSMLEKMFPQNGSSYPEIRFKGFTDPWEQRKFDEVFDCTVPNNTLSRAELSYDEGTVLNVHYGDVLIKYGSVLDVQKDDIPRIPHRCREDFNGALLQDGDVIIADTAEDETTGKTCEIGNLQGSAIVSGLHTMVCRPRNRMALGYLGYYLNSNAYHHQLLPLMQGIKVLSLSRSNIQKTSVSYPIAVKEQQLIAYYFSQLDNLITLHQRELEKLQNIKKSMLEKMFV
jgi:type I restriction enzyme, S subunit